MSTTTLFVDLLIIGMQVAIWLSLLLLSLFGFDWIDLQQVKGWETTITFLTLPIVYPLGIFIDEFADWLLSGWRSQIQKQYRMDRTKSVMALLMQSGDDKLAELYKYLRIRIRLSRSTALNACIIALVVPVFVARQLCSTPAEQKWAGAVAVCSGCVVICAAALVVWNRLTHNFYYRCAVGWELLAKKQIPQGGASSPAPDESLQPTEPA